MILSIPTQSSQPHRLGNSEPNEDKRRHRCNTRVRRLADTQLSHVCGLDSQLTAVNPPRKIIAISPAFLPPPRPRKCGAEAHHLQLGPKTRLEVTMRCVALADDLHGKREVSISIKLSYGTFLPLIFSPQSGSLERARLHLETLPRPRPANRSREPQPPTNPGFSKYTVRSI